MWYMYPLDVCNLDSAPSVPRRWPSMKKRSTDRIEKAKKRGAEGKEEEISREREREKVDVEVSRSSRLGDRCREGNGWWRR